MNSNKSQWIDPDNLIDGGTLTKQEYLDLGTNRQIGFAYGLIELPSPPRTTHHRILLELLDLLCAFVRPKRLGKALFLGIRVQLWEGKYREPDIVFMRSENEARALDEYWIGADLVMEIVCGIEDIGDRDRDLVMKRQEYAQAVIPEYWIVDPEESRVTVLTLAGLTYAVHGEFGRGDQATSLLLPGFAVDVTAVLDAEA